jgi:hypothetical protein
MSSLKLLPNFKILAQIILAMHSTNNNKRYNKNNVPKEEPTVFLGIAFLDLVQNPM